MLGRFRPCGLMARWSMPGTTLCPELACAKSKVLTPRMLNSVGPDRDLLRFEQQIAFRLANQSRNVLTSL
jgi:hypothetical protein